MHKPDARPKPGGASRRGDITVDCYEGVDLAPKTLESLVTWDVSGHARREQDRLCSAYRKPKETQGGY